MSAIESSELACTIRHGSNCKSLEKGRERLITRFAQAPAAAFGLGARMYFCVRFVFTEQTNCSRL